MNTDHILKLAEHIEQLDPSEYDQSQLEHPRCGTPACIAGHAVWLAGWWGRLPTGFGAQIDFAKDWLGLSQAERYALFSAHPDGLDDPPTAQDAAATLRHLAETGEVDWRATR